MRRRRRSWQDTPAWPISESMFLYRRAEWELRYAGTKCAASQSRHSRATTLAARHGISRCATEAKTDDITAIVWRKTSREGGGILAAQPFWIKRDFRAVSTASPPRLVERESNADDSRPQASSMDHFLFFRRSRWKDLPAAHYNARGSGCAVSAVVPRNQPAKD